MAVVNPASAGGKTADFWENKRKYFKKEFKNFDEYYTQKTGDAVKFSKKAVKQNYDYILAVGGDGTVNEIINGMLAAENDFSKQKKDNNSKTELIIYAHGTGSDLSRSLNLDRNINDFISLIKRGKTKEIKVIEVDYFDHNYKKRKRYFINIADCGMGAEVAKKLNKSSKKIDGSLSYFLKIFQVLVGYKNKRVKIEADKSIVYQGKINSAIIANGNYFGGGIKIAPEAELDSKKINLVLLKDFSKLGIIINLVKGYKGKHLDHPLVESYLVEEIKIYSDSKSEIELELDGESVGIVDAKFKISSKKISVLV